MTEKEKIALATICANAVIKALKENNSKSDSDSIKTYSEIAVKELQKKRNSGDINNEFFESLNDDNTSSKAPIGLTLYGINTQILDEEFICAYSSGELINNRSSEYFLEQKYLKMPIREGLNNCIKTSPAYFTHIKLSHPIVNPFFIRGKNNILSALLGIPSNDLKDIINYSKYVVIKSDEKYFEANSIISSHDYQIIKQNNYSIGVVTGSEAVKHLLDSFDISLTLKTLKAKYTNTDKTISQKIQNRINILEYFIKNDIDVKNIIISVLPIPQVNELFKKMQPRIRTDMKRLYSMVLFSNNQIKYLERRGNVEILVNNAKRILQQSVEDLFNKIIKVCMCDDSKSKVDAEKNDETLSTYVVETNKTDFDVLFKKVPEHEQHIWKYFIAMLLCLDIFSNESEQSEFHDFLIVQNSLEDKEIWNCFENDT